MRERWKMIALAGGGLLLLIGAIGCLAGVALWSAPREDGFVLSPTTRYVTTTSALVAGYLDVGASAASYSYVSENGGDAGTIRLHVQSADARPIFVGIASEADARAYLSRVPHQRIRGARLDPTIVNGTSAPPRLAPIRWAVSVGGSGLQTLDWPLSPGNWSVVVMHADGKPPLEVSMTAGFAAAWLVTLMNALLLAGALAAIAGIAAIVIGAEVPHAAEPVHDGPSPVHLTGELIEPLSRGLWLVKWLLAVPHLIVLCGLNVAFVVLTVLAWFAILFTGRYPAALFATTVGILRWNWRVGFYAYSTVATDMYPPFRLSDDAYPARLLVRSPPKLSRGLLFIKGWLLALPHYAIIAIFTGSFRMNPANDTTPSTGGLVSLLVLIAAIALLFTGRYPRGIFDLIVGLHRWVFRVITYVALMHDVYPPFRIDLGGDEPIVRGSAIAPLA